MGKNKKTCVICGREFFSPPSSKKVTCSAACRSERAARASRESKGRHWSEEKVAKRKNDQSVMAHMANLQKIGNSKAMENPKNQRGPQNKEAKVWTIYPPECDDPIVVKNLTDWARKNYDLFEPGSDDIDATAKRIVAGFSAIAQTLKGNRSSVGKRRGATSYKSWTMRGLPVDPSDDDQT